MDVGGEPDSRLLSLFSLLHHSKTLWASSVCHAHGITVTSVEAFASSLCALSPEALDRLRGHALFLPQAAYLMEATHTVEYDQRSTGLSGLLDKEKSQSPLSKEKAFFSKRSTRRHPSQPEPSQKAMRVEHRSCPRGCRLE